MLIHLRCRDGIGDTLDPAGPGASREHAPLPGCGLQPETVPAPNGPTGGQPCRAAPAACCQSGGQPCRACLVSIAPALMARLRDPARALLCRCTRRICHGATSVRPRSASSASCIMAYGTVARDRALSAFGSKQASHESLEHYPQLNSLTDQLSTSMRT
jgi:hypothetical protein